jgi:hypothetical protein
LNGDSPGASFCFGWPPSFSFCYKVRWPSIL